MLPLDAGPDRLAVDARDRLATALATTRAELVLESFDRRQESLARRVEGLLALRDRVGALPEELRALRQALPGQAPPPQVAAQAERAASDAVYAAFEARFRGSRDEIRSRLGDYLPCFSGLAPVADLGCGRGEFLELLREARRGTCSSPAASSGCMSSRGAARCSRTASSPATPRPGQ